MRYYRDQTINTSESRRQTDISIVRKVTANYNEIRKWCTNSRRLLKLCNSVYFTHEDYSRATRVRRNVVDEPSKFYAHGIQPYIYDNALFHCGFTRPVCFYYYSSSTVVKVLALRHSGESTHPPSVLLSFLLCSKSRYRWICQTDTLFFWKKNKIFYSVTLVLISLRIVLKAF